jgi:hypothetical protein
MFAVFCAEQVIGLVKEQHRDACVKAIDTAKRWLRGEVKTEECIDAATLITCGTYANAAASYAVYAIYKCAGFAAAYYASTHAIAASYVADDVTDDAKYKVVKEQRDYYNELLNLDENLEKILVG